MRASLARPGRSTTKPSRSTSRKEIVVQVNGKIRERITVAAGVDEATLKAAAIALPKVIEWMGGKEIVKVIVVRDKLVNIVVKG